MLVCDCGGGCSTQWTGKYSYSTIVMLHNTCTCSYIMINYQAYGIAPTAHVMANGKGNLIHVHVWRWSRRYYMYNKEPHVTSVREIQCMDMCDILYMSTYCTWVAWLILAPASNSVFTTSRCPLILAPYNGLQPSCNTNVITRGWTVTWKVVPGWTISLPQCVPPLHPTPRPLICVERPK